MYNFEVPYSNQYRQCSSYGMDFTVQGLNTAINLMREAVLSERSDELLYSHLISIAPTDEEKNIIASIRDDERNHRQWFREIYRYYTNEDVMGREEEGFLEPESYLEGISNSIFGELNAMEKYRFIREGIPSRLYRDVVFRILTDEMKHATKYNYILNKNVLNKNKFSQ